MKSGSLPMADMLLSSITIPSMQQPVNEREAVINIAFNFVLGSYGYLIQ